MYVDRVAFVPLIIRIPLLIIKRNWTCIYGFMAKAGIKPASSYCSPLDVVAGPGEVISIVVILSSFSPLNELFEMPCSLKEICAVFPDQ